MSSMNDMHEEGEARYQQFPSQASNGRVLCLKGHDTSDGSWNYYALAWPETLPRNAILMKGTTFVSYNHYDYDNMWHGLTTLMPFVSWHIKSQCVVPKRWVLYHWGEIRMDLALWVRTLLGATFGVPIQLENFDGNGTSGYDPPACFEEAVVMRRNEGGMSRSKILEVYDLIRCKSRMYCNVSTRNNKEYYSSIGMTLLMRDGARSFKNPNKVVDVFKKSCMKVEGCKLMVVYPHNLSICEQVKLMSSTDILVSPHGAQLANMILMDRNSSVMEFFPKGWLELAGVGQYAFQWLARWSGMRHEGAWRDPVSSEPCQYEESDPKCMPVVKTRKIGLDETYFSEWAERVLSEVKSRKSQDVFGTRKSPVSGVCGCA